MKEYLNRKKIVDCFSLCLVVVVIVCICAEILTAQNNGITTKDQKAKEALDATRKALGGADKIDGIKSLIIKGSETILSNTYDFEILMMFPDSFIQVNYINPRTRSTSYGIFQGEMLPKWPFAPAAKFKPLPDGKVMLPDGEIISSEPSDKYIATVSAEAERRKNRWAHFLIGLIAKADPAPLTLSSGSTAGVFNITNKDGVTGVIEFDAKTGYPTIVRYKNSPGQANDVMKFEDRFSVNGIMFPRSITVTSPEMINNTDRRIKEVLINSDLSLKDFEQFK